jgi:hypothetical protein
VPAEPGNVKDAFIPRVDADDESPIGREDALSHPGRSNRQVSKSGLAPSDDVGEPFKNGGIFGIVARLGRRLIAAAQ